VESWPACREGHDDAGPVPPHVKRESRPCVPSEVLDLDEGESIRVLSARVGSRIVRLISSPISLSRSRGSFVQAIQDGTKACR
jgi:hypothetical protein